MRNLSRTLNKSDEIVTELVAALEEFPAFLLPASSVHWPISNQEQGAIDLHRYPRLHNLSPELKKRKSKAISKDFERADEDLSQILWKKMDQALEAESVAEYILGYKRVLKKVYASKPVTGPNPVGFDSYFVGPPEIDFSKTVFPSRSTKEWLERRLEYSIYVEQRVILSLIDICLAVGMRNVKRRDKTLRVDIGDIVSKAPDQFEAYYHGKLSSESLTRRFGTKPPSAWELFTSNARLKTALAEWANFYVAVGVDPVFLQTNFGKRCLSYIPLRDPREASHLAKALNDSTKRPLGVDWARTHIFRALLLMKAQKSELIRSPACKQEVVRKALQKAKLHSGPEKKKEHLKAVISLIFRDNFKR